MKIVLKTAFLVIFVAPILFMGTANADSVSKNHEFTEVRLGYPAGNMCSFQYGPVYFCDERHLAEMKEAIKTRRADFNRKFILLSILERKEYHQQSLVAIDVRTGVVYPLPFDFYSGNIDAKGNVRDYGRIVYTVNSDRVCVVGSIVAHRQIDTGKLCWNFDGEKFVGHFTPYMD